MQKYLTQVFSSDSLVVPQCLDEKYFPELDGIRGIAILTVIIGHICIDSPLSVYIKGNIGVEIFYVLSGFLITTLLLKEKIKSDSVSFKRFYIRRALRILPVAYLFLIILICLNWIYKLNLSATSFLASFFFTRNLPFNYGPDGWYNGHFYSLAVEEQFYLIFPLFLVYNLRYYIKFVIGLMVIIPILNYLFYHNWSFFYSNGIIHRSLLIFFNFFSSDTTSILIGTLLSILMFNGTLPEIKKRNYFMSFIVFIIAILIRNSMPIDNGYFISLIFSVLIALVIYFSLGSNDLFSQVLRKRLLIKVGTLSYSLYIWQQIFTKYPPWGGNRWYLETPLFNIPLLFLVAFLSYHFYEVFFLKLKNRFK